MPVSVADVACGFALPALVAGGLLVVLQRFVLAEFVRKIAASAALAAGFVTGYALLGLGQWEVKYFWHWLPYVTMLSVCGSALTAGERWLRVAGEVGCLALAVLAAWLLVPTWPHLEPTRAVHIAVWSSGVFVLALLLDPLTRPAMASRLPRGLLSTVLAGTMFAAVVVVLLSESLRFTQFAGAAAGSMLGIAIVNTAWPKQTSLHGIAFTFAVLSCALLLVAQVDSHSAVPLISYAVVPLAPLGLWLAKLLGEDASRPAWKSWALLLPLPVVICAGAIGLAVAWTLG